MFEYNSRRLVNINKHILVKIFSMQMEVISPQLGRNLFYIF